jgi:hypothetical protein
MNPYFLVAAGSHPLPWLNGAPVARSEVHCGELTSRNQQRSSLGSHRRSLNSSGRPASRSFIDWNNEEPAMTGSACSGS